MSDIAIKVENLSKLYRIGEPANRSDTLAGALFAALRAPVDNFRRLRRLTKFDSGKSADDVLWALRDVSFEVKRGQVVGIIGRNGAGKSTLLKVLSRITEPTCGRVVIRGRVGSLLEVGTGFHPELTGRENIYMNGSILGMSKKEIDNKFDEIVDFSGVEKFLDTPVKRYSSGMTVRLAFAVAAHLNPEILIVDEVLAVGDAEFQEKCLGKMESVSRGEGKTVLFVSHNMGAIRKLCSRVILLRQGRLVSDGDANATIAAYLTNLDRGASDPFNNNPDRSGNGRAAFISASVIGPHGQPTTRVTAGLPVTLVFRYRNPNRIRNLDCLLTIFNSNGLPVSHLSTRLFKEPIEYSEEGALSCRIPKLPLPPGRYRVAAALQEGGINCDLIPNILVFDVDGSVFFSSGLTPDPRYCSMLVEHSWTSWPVVDSTEPLHEMNPEASSV